MKNKCVLAVIFSALIITLVTSTRLAPSINAQSNSSMSGAESTSSNDNSTTWGNTTTSIGMGSAINTSPTRGSSPGGAGSLG